MTDSEKPDFKTLLDETHEWPCDYVFKFIVRQEQLATVTERLPGAQITTKASSKGKYVSVTATQHMTSSDEVVAIYQRVSDIEGIMTL